MGKQRGGSEGVYSRGLPVGEAKDSVELSGSIIGSHCLSKSPDVLPSCLKDPTSLVRSVSCPDGISGVLWESRGVPQGLVIKGMSEDMFVNLPKTSKELPDAAKKQRFTEAEQCVDGSADFSGDGWPSENDEQKPFVESPEQEGPQMMSLETAQENDTPCGGESDENQCRANRQNRSDNNNEVAESVPSDCTFRSLDEVTVQQWGNKVKDETCEESLTQNLYRLTGASVW
uniref:Uncharacterized protein n=1 Tax=Sphaerodactylus townsendi TaxID=933632 RepID=A0ACB8EG80_9SAUR